MKYINMELIQKITLKVIEMDHFPPPKIHFPGIMTSFPVNPVPNKVPQKCIDIVVIR